MISIIIPCYNEEKYIGMCLQSIMANRTDTKYEVIVVNNASTDQTEAIAAKYPIKVVAEPRKGLCYAKNTGAQQAAGDVLCFLDADCTVDNQFINKLDSLLSENPDLDAFGGPYIYKDGGLAMFVATNYFRYFVIYHMLLKVLSGYTTMPGGCMVVKKPVFSKLGGFNVNIQNIVLPEDIEFSIRLGKQGFKAKYFNGFYVTSSYRRHKGKLTSDGFKRFIYTVKLLSNHQTFDTGITSKI